MSGLTHNVSAQANELLDHIYEYGTNSEGVISRINSLCDAAVEQLRAELAASREREARMQWQPIETAPRDGREVVLAVQYRAGIQHGVLVGHYMGGGCCIEDHPPIDAGWYFWNGCMFDRAAKPTHWMPLPHHPEWKPGGWQVRKQSAALAEGSRG